MCFSICPCFLCNFKGWTHVQMSYQQLIKECLPDYWNIHKSDILPLIPGCNITKQCISFPKDVFWCVPNHFVTLLIRVPLRKEPFPYWPCQEAEPVLFIQWIWVCFSYSFLKYHFIKDSFCIIQPKFEERKEETNDMCLRDGGNRGHMQAKYIWVVLKQNSVDMGLVLPPDTYGGSRTSISVLQCTV